MNIREGCPAWASETDSAGSKDTPGLVKHEYDCLLDRMTHAWGCHAATLFTPPGYDKERDGRLPCLVWAYPREFKSKVSMTAASPLLSAVGNAAGLVGMSRLVRVAVVLCQPLRMHVWGWTHTCVQPDTCATMPGLRGSVTGCTLGCILCTSCGPVTFCRCALLAGSICDNHHSSGTPGQASCRGGSRVLQCMAWPATLTCTLCG